jgi:hypothetical protein
MEHVVSVTVPRSELAPGFDPGAFLCAGGLFRDAGLCCPSVELRLDIGKADVMRGAHNEEVVEHISGL